MRKKIFVGITVLLVVLGFVGCNNVEEKSQRVIQMEDQIKYKELDAELGLEDITNKNFKNLLEPEVVMHSEYPKYRANKIKAENITEESINDVVDRAKYLVNIYFNDSVRKPINYIYMKQINDIDLLGIHLKKDLALNLLRKCVDFGTVEDINKKIEDNDDSIYWYNYVGELLYQYYKNTSDFLPNEKELIINYLIQMKNYIPTKVECIIEDIIDMEAKDLTEEINNIKTFLENYQD